MQKTSFVYRGKRGFCNDGAGTTNSINKEKMIMALIPPVFLIRRNYISKKLRKANATCEKTAKTFAEAGVLNPDAFAIITETMVKQGVLGKTMEGKYYLNKH